MDVRQRRISHVKKQFRMRPMIGPQTFVLPLQNGLEAPAQLSEALGDQHVLGGLCGLFCYVEGPGHIVHTGTDPFGE